MMISDPSWQESLNFLRSARSVPAALMNAVVLCRTRERWEQAVIARTSMHDLWFTLPGDAYPFTSSVRVKADGLTSQVIRQQADSLATDEFDEAAALDHAVDEALEWLTWPARVCRRCGLEVKISADQFEVFERMHYTCFHYLFEHDPFDPDEECTAGGCPSASVSPDTPDESRDALVEELIDDLIASELGQQSIDVHISRQSPGVLEATFDDHTFLVTVRRAPAPRR
jgi:hypothetical protein